MIGPGESKWEKATMQGFVQAAVSPYLYFEDTRLLDVASPIDDCTKVHYELKEEQESLVW